MRIKKIAIIISSLVLMGVLSACSGSVEAEVDVDLTALSETTMFSELSNMLIEPEEYDGKTVKITGVCATYHDDTDGKDYYALVLVDKAGCCSQVVEFDLADGESGSEFVNDEKITIQGTFSSEKRKDYYYCHFVDVRPV